MQRALLLVSLFSILGCELLFAPPPAAGGPVRGRDDGDEGEGEGEGPGEGEGEGEGNLPPDIRPDPLGPSIQSFSSSLNRLSDSDSTTLTVVVTDPDGTDDIIGPLLLEPISGTTLGTLSQTAPGTFTATVSWNLFGTVGPIDFVRDGDSRFIRVQFSDNAGHQVTQTQKLELFCEGDGPACNSSCGAVRCPGQDNSCLSTGSSPSADQLCGACNLECQACSDGCACFQGSSQCNGGADCLGLVNNQGQGTSSCLVNAGLSLRADGFLAWDLDGVDHAVLLDRNFAMPSSVSTVAIGERLCAGVGTLDFAEVLALPADLRSTRTVVTVEDGCSANNLAACEPVLALSSDLNSSFEGVRMTCISGSVGEGSIRLVGANERSGRVEVRHDGVFGPVCDDSFDQVDAQVVCRQLGFGGGSVFVAGNGTTPIMMDDVACTGTETRLIDCPSRGLGSSDCGHTEDVGVTCDGGGEGEGETGDFSCVDSGTRQIATTGSFSGSTSGTSVRSGSCGASASGGGPEQAWKFTPPTTGTFTFSTAGSSANLDTALYVLSACSAGTELGCGDDDASNITSRLSLALTAGQPVVVVVDGFDSGDSGSYQLTITSP